MPIFIIKLRRKLVNCNQLFVIPLLTIVLCRILGLPQEFDSVIALIESHIPQITTKEAEFILVQELQLRKYTRLESSHNRLISLKRVCHILLRVTTRIHTQTPMLCIQISIPQIHKVLVVIITVGEAVTVEDTVVVVVVGAQFNVKCVSSIITQL